jgi:SSS family transporter
MIDYAVIAAYIIAINIIGFAASKTATMDDYFKGRGVVPWPAACFSIVATETSTLTFISIPGLAYVADLGFLQVALGYILGRTLVALVLIPRYFRGDVESTYHYLQKRFSPLARRFISVIFHITRLLADAIRLFATAIPLAMLLGMDGEYLPAIALIGAATFMYTLYGGIRSVVIVDSVQLALYLTCAVLGLYLVSRGMNSDFFGVLAMIPENSLRWFHLGLGEEGGLWKGYTIFSGIIGGAFLSFASHGTDHLMVQRALSCKTRSDAQKAMVMSGFIVFAQFFLFLFLGLFIRALLEGRSFARSDEIMPFFIINHLPPGVKGLMLAGIFAAAMSSLSSSINSLAASTAMDLLGLSSKRYSERKKMFISRVICLAWTAAIMGLASMLRSTTGPLVELGLSIASITYGGMLAVFLLGSMRESFSESAALTGVVVSMGVVLYLMLFHSLFWTWYVPLGFAVALGTAMVLNGLLGGGRGRLSGTPR